MTPETLTILKSFSSINKSIRIEQGNEISIYSSVDGVFAYAKLEDYFPRTFSIYDLNQWLATLSLFNNPTVEYDERNMIIRENSVTAKYRYSPASITADQPHHSKLQIPEHAFTFKLAKEKLQGLMKASSVMGLEFIELSTTKYYCFSRDSKGNPIDNEYVEEIENVSINESTSQDIQNTIKDGVLVKVASMKLIPNDYNVIVTPSRVVFETEDKKLKYITSIVRKTK